MKKLEKLIKQTILEVLTEETYAGKTALNTLKTNTTYNSLKPDAKKSAEKELEDGGSVTLEGNLKEMARIPIMYTVDDLSKLDDLGDKVKNSKGVQGILAYLEEKGQSSVAVIAREKFDRPQQAINPIVQTLAKAGVLKQIGGSGIAASRVDAKTGKVSAPTTKQTIEPEDFLVGDGSKVQGGQEYTDDEIDASFAKAMASGDEEEFIKTLPKDNKHSKVDLSDEEYAKMMKFFSAKERLKNIDSALRQNKKIGRGGDDLGSGDTGEEAKLRTKKAELEKSIEDLVASSPYLQRRKSPESMKK